MLSATGCIQWKKRVWFLYMSDIKARNSFTGVASVVLSSFLMPCLHIHILCICSNRSKENYTYWCKPLRTYTWAYHRIPPPNSDGRAHREWQLCQPGRERSGYCVGHLLGLWHPEFGRVLGKSSCRIMFLFSRAFLSICRYIFTHVTVKVCLPHLSKSFIRTNLWLSVSGT